MSDESNAVTNQDRSPKYPRISLQDAISKIKNVHQQAGKSSIAIETLAMALGYKNALAGATQIALSALQQYGLITRGPDKKFAVSPLAVRILHPTSEEQRLQSVQQAAVTPPVFADIRKTLHDCSESVLASHLVQSRFTPDGAAKAAAVYKENSTFAKLDLAEYHKPDANLSTQETMQSPPTINREPLGQFVYPKTVDRPADVMAPPLTSFLRPSNLTLPLGSGEFVVVPKMSKDDFDLFLETLKLWEKKLILPELPPAPKESFPFIVMWKNKVGDQPVKIIGVMGEKDGQKYYQSEDGTGIPASEIFPMPIGEYNVILENLER